MRKIFSLVLLAVLGQLIAGNVFSQRGKVLSLDGTSGYMVVADKPELNINSGQSFSVTCWVNSADFAKRIISKRVSGGGAGYEFINNSSPGGQFGVNLRSTTLVNAGPPFGTSNITNASWHHLAMVVNVTDNTCRIYVDGSQQQVSTNSAIGTGSFANTVSLFFGTTVDLTTFMNIQMDDIRVWSAALSASAVQSDMTTIVTGTEPGLVAAWNFENVTGSTVPDITTGNNHPGTLNGGASIVTLPTMQYSSTSLAQTQLPAGRGDTAQRVIAVNVTTSGSTNPIGLTSLSLTLNGTTNIADVTKVKIYYTGSNSRFNTNILFATLVPSSGTITASGNQTLVGGSNYFWIAYDLSPTATEGDQLDATCEGITVGGTPVSFAPPNNTVAGSRTVLLAHKLLFSPGDNGSASYRIPAIVTAPDGSLVTVTDRRWNGSGDIPNKIDPVVRRSTDNGQTWSAPVTIANFGGASGAGDASLVVDKIKNPGTIICVFAANQGFMASTPTTPINIQYCKSTDNGITWSAPTDITNQIYGAGCSNAFTQNWNAAFVASGRMHQLRSGRIVAVLDVRQTSTSTQDNFMIYTDDGGTTWLPSTSDPTTNGIAAAGQANEAKVVELNSGSLMMSTRHPGSRLISTSGDGGITWGAATSQSQLVEPGCNGDFIRYTSTKDGFNKDRLLHSIPYNSTSRQNVSVLLSYDEGTTWPVQKAIFPLASAYSGLTVLNDGTLGLYYENGENGDIYDMYFARFSLNWLTNGADTYLPSSGGNLPPKDSITSPANNAAFTAGSNIVINATASSPNTGGSITKVDFYQGTTLLGSSTVSPYSFTWNNVAAGNYSLTVKATDNGGLVTTSSAVTIIVYGPPAVSITSPASNSTFATGSNITINATASSPNSGGSISKVDFYNGSALLGTSTTSPYSFTWSNVPSGIDTLTAKATDNRGLVTTSAPVIITVSGSGNAAPSVAITSPANNAVFSEGANIIISAAASSPNAGGSIARVDFYSGSSLLGTSTASPYSFTWNSVQGGIDTLTAKATDNTGLTATSPALIITVNAGPTGNVLSLNGTQYMYVNDHADINIGNGQSKTITAWIKSTTVSSGRIISKRAPSFGAGYEFITNNKGVFGLNAKTTTGSSLGASFTSTPNVEDGKWHHVAMVVDQTASAGTTGKFVRGYVDGVLLSTGPLFDAAADFTNTVNLIVGGVSMASPGGQFTGSIDNVRIWNWPMTAMDIARDRNAIISGPAAGLLAAWDFEKVLGTTVTDISGNNHPGTLVSNPAIVPASATGIVGITARNSGQADMNNSLQATAPFRVISYPNPAPDEFTLRVTGGIPGKAVTTEIMDAGGRLVGQIITAPGDLIRFGHELRSGVYFAHVVQGTNTQILKLVKW